ncbi:MAG: hypothetical protein IH589_16025 [Anaerolineales bacterium]|nr:hypothetical protein [Anaerolineales bacterium]
MHTNLITGIYLCAAVTCFAFYRNNESSDISALAIFGGLSFFAFMVSRVENGFISVAISLLIFLKGRYPSKIISAISVLTSILMIAYIIKLLEYTPYKMESYLILFSHTMLVLFNIIVVLFERTAPLMDKILDNFPRIFFITALVLVGVYLIVIDFERVIINLQTFILNGHLRGYLGMFWSLGIASVVILIFVQGDNLKWTNLFILVFCGEVLLYFLLFTNLGAYPDTELFGSPTRSVIHYMFLLLPYLLTNYLAMFKSVDF